MCVTDNVTISGKIQHLANSTNFIAPDKVLTYEGSVPVNVNALSLAVQGGGRFSSWDNNSIMLNRDGGVLKLADNSTTLSHLGLEQSIGTTESDKFLNVEASAGSDCAGDDTTTEGSSKIVVELFDQEGNSNLGLSASSMLSISAFTNSRIPSQKSLTVSGKQRSINSGQSFDISKWKSVCPGFSGINNQRSF